MTGNSFGKLFKVTTWGESHGKAIGVVIDGMPPRIPLDEKIIQTDLDRRSPGKGGAQTSRKESDKVEILSGVFEGKTTGTPISLLIWNKDQKSSHYDDLKEVFRPGHADFTYQKKYGIRDHRGGGRSSGRETAARVAAGAVAKQLLHGIEIMGFSRQIGKIEAGMVQADFIETNPLRCPDPETFDKMKKEIPEDDSVGGIAEFHVAGVPPGLGDPVFEKLDALLGAALFSLGSVKGVEFGDGFDVAGAHGSENNDAIGKKGFLTNHAGGVLGGISNGDLLIIRAAIKPTPSISKKQKTITTNGKKTNIEIKGRHDRCIVPRIIPVCEAMIALVLADRMLIQRSKM